MKALNDPDLSTVIKELYSGIPGSENITDIHTFRKASADVLVVRIVMSNLYFDIEINGWVLNSGPKTVVDYLCAQIGDMNSLFYRAY